MSEQPDTDPDKVNPKPGDNEPLPDEGDGKQDDGKS
jgi:hypothetical protein